MFSKNIKNILFIVAFLIIFYGLYNVIFGVQEGLSKEKRKKRRKRRKQRKKLIKKRKDICKENKTSEACAQARCNVKNFSKADPTHAVKEIEKGKKKIFRCLSLINDENTSNNQQIDRSKKNNSKIDNSKKNNSKIDIPTKINCFSENPVGSCYSNFVTKPPTTIDDEAFKEKFEKAYDSCDGDFNCQTCVMAKATILDQDNTKNLNFEFDQEKDIEDFIDYTKGDGNCTLTNNENSILESKKEYLESVRLEGGGGLFDAINPIGNINPISGNLP